MMREIKFRAWIDNQKKMLSPYFFVNDENFITQYGSSKPDAVMQYTGLKDKNGVEIYEGDIVKRIATNPYWDNDLVQIDSVIYDLCEFKTKTFEINLRSLGAKYLNTYEIIGNIYENRELLEK